MNYKHIFVFFLLSLMSMTSLGFTQETKKTLGEVKKELLGKEVIITGVRDHRENSLLLWFLADGASPKGYTRKKGEYRDLKAPYRFKGARGIVESIDLNPLYRRNKGGKSTDVFGDPIEDNTLIDPDIDVVVRLKDDTLLMTSSVGVKCSQTRLILELASNIDAEKDEILKNIDTLIGKVIYPYAHSVILQIDTNVSDIPDFLFRFDNRLRDIPNFSPLTIVKAKYLEKEHAIFYKVEFLNGRAGIVFSEFWSDPMRKKRMENLTFLDRVIPYYFLSEIPKDLTEREIEAIKKGEIFRGMSQAALIYSWGKPKKENDYGKGGRQLVYDNQYVYLDGGKIVDWQSFSK